MLRVHVQSTQTRMLRVASAMNISRSGHIRCGHHMKLCPIYVTYGIRAGSHSCRSCASGCRVLSDPRRSCNSTACALPPISRPRGGGGSHMQFLLVPKEKISACEASCTFWALKGLFFGVRSFVTLEMLQSRKGSLACPANMRARLVCLGRKVWYRLGVTGGVVS